MNLIATRTYSGQFQEDRETLEKLAREMGLRFKVHVSRSWFIWPTKTFVVEGPADDIDVFESRADFLLVDLLA